MSRISAALCVALWLSGCGPAAAPPASEQQEKHHEGVVTLSPEQISAAGITLARPIRGAAGAAVDARALIESDPDATRVVAANISGRIVSLTRNLGDAVSRGDTLAIIESREGADLQAELERARTRLDLARATRERDEALYAQGFRPLREVEISRATYAQAETDVRQARQRIAATGARAGDLNRIVIVAPISGRVIARPAMLGQYYSEEAEGSELYRIANLGRVNLSLSLSAADAALVRVGNVISVSADGRDQEARIRYVSPVLDEATRLVRILADMDNSRGHWRVGEPVQARIRLSADQGAPAVLLIPANAVQTVEDGSVVFVRTQTGFRAVPVALGRREGPMVTIAKGLAGDEEIAAENSFTLKAELGKGEAEHGGH